MGDVNAGLAGWDRTPPKLYRVGAAPRAALAACASASRRPLARVGLPLYRGRVGTACQPSCLSRALPAGRGKASPCTPTQGGRGEATSLPFYAPVPPYSVLCTPYSDFTFQPTPRELRSRLLLLPGVAVATSVLADAVRGHFPLLDFLEEVVRIRHAQAIKGRGHVLLAPLLDHASIGQPLG